MVTNDSDTCEHRKMYREVESLCCTIKANIAVCQLYSNFKKKQNTIPLTIVIKRIQELTTED